MDDLSNIKSRLLAEQTEEELSAYIRSEQIPVGGKIPSEDRLGKMFRVGRSTVREAVKSLVSKGVLEIRRGSGTYVLNTSGSGMDPLGLSGIEDKVQLALDLLDVRMMLEPEIAERAAFHANAADISALEDLCEVIEEKISRGETYLHEDTRFHTYIARCSRNKVVEQLIPIIDTAVVMAVHVTHRQLAEETIITHRNIVNAIKEKDIIGARTAMMMHLTINRNMIKDIAQNNRAKTI
jgi:Transcriptional regulators